MLAQRLLMLPRGDHTPLKLEPQKRGSFFYLSNFSFDPTKSPGTPFWDRAPELVLHDSSECSARRRGFEFQPTVQSYSPPSITSQLKPRLTYDIYFVGSDSGGDAVPLRRGPDLRVCVRSVGASFRFCLNNTGPLL